MLQRGAGGKKRKKKEDVGDADIKGVRFRVVAGLSARRAGALALLQRGGVERMQVVLM